MTPILAPLGAAVNASLCVRAIHTSLRSRLSDQGKTYSTPELLLSTQQLLPKPPTMQALGRFANLEAPSQVRSLAGQEEQSGVLPEVSIAGKRGTRISEDSLSLSELWRGRCRP